MSDLSKITKTQEAELKKAISSMRRGAYGATAMKFELEASLRRPMGREQRRECADCSASGYIACTDCEDGYTSCSITHGTQTAVRNCNRCDQDGDIVCNSCDGSERSDCAPCEGRGTIILANTGWGDTQCRDFLKSNVPKEARDALIFCKFYNDGSVDSEFTFTLPIEVAHYAVYFVEAFNKLVKAIGNGCDTQGAGMHIAVLNSRNGIYPAGNRLDSTCLTKFTEAITPLLPAMYFLASASHDSRSLRYRGPMVGTGKNTAINYYHQCFEFRLFETCYGRPMAMIDNIIVISNALKFYKKTGTNTRRKLGSLGKLGFREGRGLERFYFSTSHLRALERGVELLRPTYKSFESLKKERNFNVDSERLAKDEAKRIKEWESEFVRVKERRKYELDRLYSQAVDEAERHNNSGYGDRIDPQKHAKAYVKILEDDTSRNLKGTCSDYIKQKMSNFQTQNVEYSITI